MRHDALANPRSCIVTREARPREELIRFVADPDGKVVPDLAGRLPGRGVWVTANARILAQAVQRGRFAYGLKRPVTVRPDLVEQVDALLETAALNALSLAKKAGLVVTGFGKVDATIRSGAAVLVLHATDAAADGIRKLGQAAHSVLGEDGGPSIKQLWNSRQMSLALGGENVVHAAAIQGGATDALGARITTLERFRS